MATRGRVRGPGRALPWCAGALFLAVSVGAALEAPRVPADDAIAETKDLMAEDRAVCVRLGAGPDTGRFSGCAVELSWVRAQERQRVMVEFELLP